MRDVPLVNYEEKEKKRSIKSNISLVVGTQCLINYPDPARQRPGAPPPYHLILTNYQPGRLSCKLVTCKHINMHILKTYRFVHGTVLHDSKVSKSWVILLRPWQFTVTFWFMV